MSWFAVDDSAYSHPKIVAAGNAAMGLWTPPDLPPGQRRAARRHPPRRAPPPRGLPGRRRTGRQRIATAPRQRPVLRVLRCRILLGLGDIRIVRIDQAHQVTHEGGDRHGGGKTDVHLGVVADHRYPAQIRFGVARARGRRLGHRFPASGPVVSGRALRAGAPPSPGPTEPTGTVRPLGSRPPCTTFAKLNSRTSQNSHISATSAPAAADAVVQSKRHRHRRGR